MSQDSRDGAATLAILATKLDYLIATVDKIDCRTEANENNIAGNTKRIDAIDSTLRIVKWLGGAITAILLAQLVAALRAWLGL